MAARGGEGASTVARELAFFAAKRAGRSVWLVDLDLLFSPQYAALAADPERFGVLGEAAAASPDGSTCFTVRPPARLPDGQACPDARYLTAHRVGDHRWWVTRFHRESLRSPQAVHVLAGGDYWAALRRYADLIIVDCPAPDRSQAGITVAPYMDQTVMVVAADQIDVRAPVQLRDAIAAAGGKVAGVFFNRAALPEPRFLKAFGA
jgi:hypothetical protein